MNPFWFLSKRLLLQLFQEYNISIYMRLIMNEESDSSIVLRVEHRNVVIINMQWRGEKKIDYA